jgi:hypothetical protein
VSGKISYKDYEKDGQRHHLTEIVVDSKGEIITLSSKAKKQEETQ